MRRFGLLALVLLLTATPSFAKDTVVIYTAIEPEQVTDRRPEAAGCEA